MPEETIRTVNVEALFATGLQVDGVIVQGAPGLLFTFNNIGTPYPPMLLTGLAIEGVAVLVNKAVASANNHKGYAPPEVAIQMALCWKCETKIFAEQAQKGYCLTCGPEFTCQVPKCKEGTSSDDDPLCTAHWENVPPSMIAKIARAASEGADQALKDLLPKAVIAAGIKSQFPVAEPPQDGPEDEAVSGA